MTFVSNFFNFSNFCNFKKVELAKVELLIFKLNVLVVIK